MKLVQRLLHLNYTVRAKIRLNYELHRDIFQRPSSLKSSFYQIQWELQGFLKNVTLSYLKFHKLFLPTTKMLGTRKCYLLIVVH